jgi:hypothetical protein
MAKQSELTPAERLAQFRAGMTRPVVLRGEVAVSAASVLVDGKPGEFVATGHSGYTVSHPLTGKALTRGERFEVDALHFHKIAKALELGRVMPAHVWDDVQEYDEKRSLWESELQPCGAEYANSLKAADQAEALLVGARAALEAAQERVQLTREAAAMSEERLTQALDVHGL